MASGSNNLTSYKAKQIIGSSVAASPAGALLFTGENYDGNTWIYYYGYGGTTNPWGIRHDTQASKIIVKGNGTDSFWIKMDTGDTYIYGKVGIGYDPNTSGNSYKLYVNGGSTFLNYTTAASANNLSGQLIVANTNGGAVAVELWRSGNASWQIINDGGVLFFKNNWTTAKQNTYSQTALVMNHSTGNAAFAGTLAVGQTTRVTDYKLYVNGSTNITGTTTFGDYLYRAYTASSQTPMIWMNSSDYDNYLWQISSGTANGKQYYGYGLKYIGTGSGVANYLQLIADNQNGTDVIAIGINQSGQIGLGANANTNYRLYVSGTSYFSSTMTSAGNISLYASGTNDSPQLIFQRGTIGGDGWDWRIYNTGGTLKFDENEGSWTTRVSIYQGTITASSFTGDLTGTADYAHSLWQRYNIAKGTKPTDSTLWLSNWFNYQTGTTFNEADRIGGGIYSWIGTNGDSGLGLISYQHSTSNIKNARIEIISTQSANPYINIYGQLIIQPENSEHEGGQIQLVKGPSDSKNCYIDTAYNTFRIHNGTFVPFQLSLAGAGNFVEITDCPLWIKSSSYAGGTSNRLTTTSGMPGNMQYGNHKRGTQIYSNGIAFCDPYNGDSNNDAGWIRHLETTANTGELEIAVGDDAANETIVFRQYKTDNTIARTLTLLAASGDSYFPGSIALDVGKELHMKPTANSNYYAVLNTFLNGNIGLSAAGGSLFLGYFNTGGVWIQKGTNASNNTLGHGLYFEDNSEGGNIRIYSGNCGTYGSYYWEIDAYNGNLRFYNVNSAGTYKGEAAITKDTVLVTRALWNDYAECRNTSTLEAGRVVTETSNGIMNKTSERLMPGCKVISDTYGHLIGLSKKAKTPIAVSGRVLVYPYQDRDKYELGAALCSAPNGTADIMTREEVMKYPERIIGTVSEIPEYEDWYSSENIDEKSVPIKVNGRIWIYVR